MNVSQTDSSSLALLRQQISQDIQPWVATADVIQFVSQRLLVTVLSNPPPNDIFNFEKNIEEGTVIYDNGSTDTSHHKITELSEALDIEIGSIQSFMTDKIKGQQRAVQLTVNVLKNRAIVQTFSYKPSLLT